MVEEFEGLNRCFSEMDGRSIVKEDHKEYFKITMKTNTHHEIAGTIEIGHYGTGGAIIDVETGNKNYEKKPHEADMEPHYFLLLSKGLNKNSGFLISERIGNDGIETILEEIIVSCFKDATIEKEAVLTKDYVKKMIEQLKDIRLYKTVPSKDFTDEIRQDKEGEEIHVEVRLTSEKGKILPFIFKENFKKFIDDRESKGIFTLAHQVVYKALIEGKAKIESRELDYDYISATVQLGLTERRVKFLRSEAAMRPYFEFPRDISFDSNGWPKFDDVHKFASELVNDILKDAGSIE